MGFFPGYRSIHTIWMHHMDANKICKKMLDGNYTRMVHAVKQILEATPHKSTAVRPHLSSHKPFKEEERDMRGPAGETSANSQAIFFL